MSYGRSVIFLNLIKFSKKRRRRRNKRRGERGDEKKTRKEKIKGIEISLKFRFISVLFSFKHIGYLPNYRAQFKLET